MKKYLVIDISTTAQEGIEDSPYISWANRKGALTPEEAYSKAGLHAEYGMLCGIAAYWVWKQEDEIVKKFATGSAIRNKQEEGEALLKLCDKMYDDDVVIVGHNARDFVVPFLAKRMLANGIKIPHPLFLAIKNGPVDIMRELSCGGVSVMPLRASAWLLGIDDPRGFGAAPIFYSLCRDECWDEVFNLTNTNASVAADVFIDCANGGLIYPEDLT